MARRSYRRPQTSNHATTINLTMEEEEQLPKYYSPSLLKFPPFLLFALSVLTLLSIDCRFILNSAIIMELLPRSTIFILFIAVTNLLVWGAARTFE